MVSPDAYLVAWLGFGSDPCVRLRQTHGPYFRYHYRGVLCAKVERTTVTFARVA